MLKRNDDAGSDAISKTRESALFGRNRGKVISGLFDWQGNLVEGDDKLKVEVIRDKNRPDIWFYHMTSPKEYVFVHMPVVAGVYPAYGVHGGGTNRDARYFRYVDTPLSSHTGGVANTQVGSVLHNFS